MDALNDFFAVLSSDTCRILDLFLRLIINTVFTIIIARAFYFPKARRRDFVRHLLHHALPHRVSTHP